MKFTIKVNGIEKLDRAYERYHGMIDASLKQAGDDASNYVLDVRGLKNYPPPSSRNRPGRFKQIGNSGRYVPMGWYERGKGWHTASGKLTGSSERYGTRWTTTYANRLTTIANNTSYGKFLGGAEQTKDHKTFLWRKLTDVVKEKKSEITQIYQGYVDYVLGRIGI